MMPRKGEGAMRKGHFRDAHVSAADASRTAAVRPRRNCSKIKCWPFFMKHGTL
jgi:hypothetical protein